MVRLKDSNEVLPEFEVKREGSSYYFLFDYELWLRGEERGETLLILDMYYGNQEKDVYIPAGFGTRALMAIKEGYATMQVGEVTEAALPFWEKMVQRGIVEEIISFWE